jgi:MFS family permease
VTDLSAKQPANVVLLVLLDWRWRKPMVTASITAPMPNYAAQHPLRERNFRLFFTGSTISLVGDQFYFVALPWLVLQQTGSAIAMGTIMMAGAVPRTVLMLMGGAMSDRISPRRIMMMTAWARAILVTGVGLLIQLHLLHTWQLYALAAMFGTVDAFDSPAAEAFMPFLVKPEQLVAATSVSQVRTQLTSIVSPAPAGFIVKGLGLACAFFIDAVSFLFIIGALLQLPDPPPTQDVKKSMWHSILEGLHYVGKDIPLRSLMVVAIGINFCLAGPMGLGLAYVAKTRFGSPVMLGIMFSSMAVGVLCGALLAGIWKIRRRGIMILLVSLVLALLLGSLGMVNGRWTFPAILLLMGVAAGMANIQIGAWIMQRIDSTVRGRVSSLLTLGEMGTIPISLALAGLLIAINLKLMFLLAGSVVLLVTMAAATQKTIRQIQ